MFAKVWLSVLNKNSDGNLDQADLLQKSIDVITHFVYFDLPLLIIETHPELSLNTRVPFTHSAVPSLFLGLFVRHR